MLFSFIVSHALTRTQREEHEALTRDKRLITRLVYLLNSFLAQKKYRRK